MIISCLRALDLASIRLCQLKFGDFLKRKETKVAMAGKKVKIKKGKFFLLLGTVIYYSYAVVVLLLNLFCAVNR